MSFTDVDLANAMSRSLVRAGTMTSAEKASLLQDPTENNVRHTLSEDQLAKFSAYWALLGRWMAGKGGDITATTGTSVPGREGGNPSGLGNKAIYNDAFRDVNAHIGGDDFLPVKAVSNQLRFVSLFTE